MAQTRPDVFEPARYSTFRLLGHSYEPKSATVTLSYALDEELHFEELIQLPAGASEPVGERAQALDRVLSLLHLVAGVSYYKAAAPPRIELPCELGPATASLLNAVYKLGLGEFAYENRLDGPVNVSFPASLREPPAPVRLENKGGSLVAIGGGKDSIVALEAARAAGEVTLFAVGERPAILRTARAAGLELLSARRTISPLLLQLNEAGALNGHVPVTAIVSLIALATAVLHGQERVVMANERSASQGNVRWGGIEVNHQWSKSAEFEDLLRAALSSEIATGVDYFSLLRPVGELAIAKAFASMPAYHEAFLSCNSGFRLSGASDSWCCDCAKCRFVFLALAPFMDPIRLSEIFGSDLLDQDSQIPGFMALCGFGADKPFECVGEHEESLAAFRLLAESERWREHAVVRHARKTVLRQAPAQAAQAERLLEIDGPHNIPATFVESLRARL